MLDKVINKLESWLEGFVLMLPNLAAALGVMLGFWVLSLLASRVVDRIMARISDHRTLNELVRKLVKLAVQIAGLLIALHVLDLDGAATTFLAGAGIVGIALGFAFQDLTANFIAGVAMALRRPMQVGDLIEAHGYYGTIEHIQLRSTFVRTLQGPLVMIPNRKLFEDAVVLYTTLGRRRVDLEVGVSYGDDLDTVKRITLAAVEGIDRLRGEDVKVFFTGFGDSSINLVVHIWVDFKVQTDFLRAQSDAVMAIKSAYDANDITIPFPIRTLDFGIKGGEQLREHLPAA